jgi:hypothetical protein
VEDIFESLKTFQLTEEDLENNTKIISNTAWHFDRTGIKHSKESKELMSESHTGIPLLDLHKKSISLSLTGKSRESFSDEWKQNISNSKKGNKYRLGKPFTEESKEKISKANKGKIPWNKGKTGMKYNKSKLKGELN